MTAARRPERGLVRGCCLLVSLAVVMLGVLAFLAVRTLAAPDLGAPPQGPDHGDSEAAIADYLGAKVITLLLTQSHAVVTLSEHDLTVLAAAHLTSPWSNVTARVRDQLIVVDGQHPYGPLTITPVAHISLSLDVTKSPPQITTRVEQLDIGQLGMPGFIRDRLVGSFASSIDVNRVFSNGSPELQVLRATIDCMRVVPGGLTLGVHRPGTQTDTSVCSR